MNPTNRSLRSLTLTPVTLSQGPRVRPVTSGSCPSLWGLSDLNDHTEGSKR